MKSGSKIFRLVVLTTFLIALSSCKGQSTGDSGAAPAILKVDTKSVKDRYRLRPDRRLVLALNAQREIAGLPAVEISTIFGNDTWILKTESGQLGVLPESPQFSDYLKVLDDHARSLTSQLAITNSGEASILVGRAEQLVFAEDFLPVLHELQAKWDKGNKTVQILSDAARLTSLLSFQSMRKTNVSDEIDAQALALVTMAHVAGASQDALTESVLSHAMGYTAHSESLAKLLPENEPLRAYLEYQNAKLEEAAVAKDATSWAKYLWLQRYSEKADFNKWFELADRLLTASDYSHFAFLKSALDIGTFQAVPAVANQVFIALFSRFSENKPAAENPLSFTFNLGQLLKVNVVLDPKNKESDFHKIDSGIKKTQLDGSIVGRGLSSRFYRSYFEGAMIAEGSHLLNTLGSIPDAQAFLSYMTPADGTTYQQVANWYQAAVDAELGKGQEANFFQILAKGESLGVSNLGKVADNITDLYTYASKRSFDAISQIFSVSDSRPSNQLFLSWRAYKTLYDIKLIEKLASNWLSLTSSYDQTSDRIWPLKFLGRTQDLKKLLSLKELHPGVQLIVLKRLADDKLLDKGEFDAELEALHKKYPSEWRIVYNLQRRLRRQSKFLEATELINEWMTLPHPEPFLEIYAKIELADILVEQKKLDEALVALTPIPGGFHGGAVWKKIQVLMGLEKAEEALQLSQALVKRYPNELWTYAANAYVLWSTGKYEEAAEFIKMWPKQITLSEWETPIGEYFQKAFESKSDDEIARAFKYMVGQYPAYHLAWMTRSFSYKDANKAFAILSSLPADNSTLPYFLEILSYVRLKQSKGEDEALKWLKIKVPQAAPDIAKFFYDNGVFELLWTFLPEQVDSEFVWLPRAMASMDKSWKSDRYQTLLQNHYAASSSDRFYKFGQFLTGGISEEELKTMSSSPGETCEVAYFIGLKKESESKFSDAIDWYRLSVEAGEPGQVEWNWSWARLQRFKEAEISVERLTPETVASQFNRGSF